MAEREPGTGEAETLRAARDDEPEVRLDPKTSMSTLTVGEIIGEGGMGIIRTAVQRSLERPVAIKSSRPGSTDADARRMLREAWVTGWLEHPGVVPVYDIVRSEEGSPVVVMRRIHGSTWEARMTDAGWAAERGARDVLEQNLRVLVRVCEIVEFAHAKGVLHRDIKPANVMLGSFGEVYLLDWGLAVALNDETAAHLPRASVVRELTGTLEYAPPEMTGLVEAPLDIRTDVYLLGAVLFEIATGVAPHLKATTALLFESIAASPPPIPPRVPARLAAVCSRALQKRPEDRYAKVSELRLDVLEFLRSRDSEHVSREAAQALERLAQACADNEPRRRIYDLYGECRFAFHEALRTWPDNEPALRGLSEATALVLERELARDPRVAAALLEDADASPASRGRGAVPKDLAERVRAAALADEKAREGYSKLAKENDQVTGRRARKILFVSLGIAWSFSQLVSDHLGPLTHMRFIAGSLLQLPLLVLGAVLLRDLGRTVFNRRMLSAVILTILAQAALFASGLALGVDIFSLRIFQIGIWTLVSACLTLLLEKRLWPMTMWLGLAFLAAHEWPEGRAIWCSFATLGVTANGVAIWSRRWASRAGETA